MDISTETFHQKDGRRKVSPKSVTFSEVDLPGIDSEADTFSMVDTEASISDSESFSIAISDFNDEASTYSNKEKMQRITLQIQRQALIKQNYIYMKNVVFKAYVGFFIIAVILSIYFSKDTNMNIQLKSFWEFLFNHEKQSKGSRVCDNPFHNENNCS